ncbi:hypothetical protein LARI1_G008445 [Lachnellula arida]|uniref:Uncharacterized protein n=1 Tax=Lachnellula arida TaxID=1316785 RepID=A0A8T9AZ33_9HELO|nr:hypothetical protein LARI1_G008445 [Lachnellula arida]
MASLFDTTRNFSFYAPPVAWVIAFIPTLAIISKTFDNRSPRTYVKSLEADQTLDKAARAQSNGFENVGLFASAVGAGNLSGRSVRCIWRPAWGIMCFMLRIRVR